MKIECNDTHALLDSHCSVGVLRQVIEKCVAGASVVDLCELGDQMILEETSKVYKKEKEMKKGTSIECTLHMMSYHSLQNECRSLTS